MQDAKKQKLEYSVDQGVLTVKETISDKHFVGHDDNEVRYTASKLIDSGNDLWAGLDYKTLATIDFKKAGIIDPKKVTRIALENAASIAGTILTTESVVYKTKDDKEEEINPMAGLM